MKADNEVALTKYESAIDRLVASNEKAIAELLKDSEKLRKDIEKLINTLTIRIIVVVALGFAVLALILK